MVFGGKAKVEKEKRKKDNSSIDHLHIPLIILSLRTRLVADECSPGKTQLITPVRLDPPVNVKDLVPARPADPLDPAVDGLRRVVLQGKGYRFGLLLLFLGSLRLLEPLGGAGGVIRCLLDADMDRRADDSLG